MLVAFCWHSICVGGFGYTRFALRFPVGFLVSCRLSAFHGLCHGFLQLSFEGVRFVLLKREKQGFLKNFSFGQSLLFQSNPQNLDGTGKDFQLVIMSVCSGLVHNKLWNIFSFVHEYFILEEFDESCFFIMLYLNITWKNSNLNSIENRDRFRYRSVSRMAVQDLQIQIQIQIIYFLHSITVH